MTLENLITDLRGQRVKVLVHNRQLRVIKPKGITIPLLMENIKKHKDALVEYLTTNPDTFVDADAIQAVEEQEHYPASDAQRRMWVLNKFEEAQAAYNVPSAYTFKGQLNMAAFEKAFAAVVERHESLRTVFVECQGELRQKIALPGSTVFQVSHIDFRGMPGNEAMAARMIQAESASTFSLQYGPLLRARLIQLEDDRYIFLMNLHHIITDGWSIEVVLNEILSYYNAAQDDKTPVLQPLAIQYRDYTLWLQQRLADKKYAQDSAYWQQQLSGELPVLELPADRPRPAVMNAAGRQQWFKLDAALSQRLLAMCREYGVSRFMLFTATIKALFYKYSGQEDIIIGTPAANRDNHEIEAQAGLYMNTLPLRTKFSGEDSFTAFLEKVKNTILDADRHKHYPFDKLVDDLQLKRDLSRSPVFDVMITVPAEASGGAPVMKGVEVSSFTGDAATAQFDLSFDIVEDGDAFLVSIIYGSSIYDDWRITQMFEHYCQLLQTVTEAPATSLHDLKYISANEQEKLVSLFNQPAAIQGLDKNYIEHFTAQAAHTPEKIAIRCGDKQLTYKELDEASNRMAHWLVAQGLEKEAFVPILFERSVETLVAIIGIFKAGGAFILLDATYPVSRLTALMANTGATILIAKSGACAEKEILWKAISNDTAVKSILLMDEMRTDDIGFIPGTIAATSRLLRFCNYMSVLQQPATPPAIKNLPGDISFVIYTSGSTGKPKGALNEHLGMLNHCLVMIDHFEIDEQSIIAQTAPPSFDISVWQLITGVLAGATTVIYPQQLIHNPAALLQQMKADRVSIVQWVPSYLTSILEEFSFHPEENFFPALKYLILCGEAIRPSLVKEWFNFCPQVKVANAYGPAEASDDVTINIIGAETFNETIAIGKPVHGCRIYILDNEQRLCPCGHIGEICIAGIAVGRGYLNDPVRTDAVFMNDPYNKETRMYRTGDMGMWQHDGTLTFIGRKDQQVKIRGQRVEPGEVEACLLQEAGVKQAVVLDVTDEQQNKDLVAFVIMNDAQTGIAALQQRLREQLPAFMVPSRILVSEEWPVTANGKTDRDALRKMAAGGKKAEREYIQPRNATEQMLLGMWEDILVKKDISVTDNFFDAGGHSLKAVRLISRIYKETGLRIELRQVFSANTIAQQAALLSTANAGKFTTITPVAEQPYYDVSHAQKRIWLLEQTHVSGVYNIPESFELAGKLDEAKFNEAFRYLVQRHESLRTTFITVEGIPKQVVHAAENFPFAIENIDLRNDAEKEKNALSLVDQESWRPFQLDKAPLLRATLIRMEDERYIFLLIMHHIVSDGWSMDIIANEVLTVYDALLQGEEPGLQPLRIHYKDYTAWQNHELSGECMLEHKNYWLSQFASPSPVLQLPADMPRPALKTYKGATACARINTVLKKELKELALRQDCTLFMLLTSAIKTLFYRYTGQEDMVIGTSVSERDHPDIENQVGFYVNMLPLRSRFSGSDTFLELLSFVKKTSLDAFSHQVYPFDQLIDDLRLSKDLSRSPLFDVVITMQNTALQDEALPEFRNIAVNDYNKSEKLAKFDLTLFFTEHEHGIEFNILYNTSIFHQSRVERMQQHFINLLHGIVKDPAVPVKVIPYLAETEKEMVLSFSKPSLLPDGFNKLTHEMIEEQAMLHPGATALVYENTRLTYKELNEEANRLAHHMREFYSIKPGDIVAVMTDRSEKMIVCMLAILKAGACWLPLEPSQPAARKAAILNDAMPALLITESGYMFDLSYYTGSLFITDIEWDTLPAINTNPAHTSFPTDRAYIIYTSGTTGAPKGVVIPHHALSAYLTWFKNAFNTGPGDSTLMLSSFAFDLGYTNLWGALITGATLVVPKAGEYPDRDLLISLLQQEAITFLKLTPSHLDIIVNDPAFPQEAEKMSLRLVITGGEAIRTDVVEQLFAALPECIMVNHYGPTETTIGTLAKVFNRVTFGAFKQQPVIGRPISESRVFVLDQNLQTVPVGITGEIAVSGNGLAIGYLNQPELTAAKFTESPFEKGRRLYLTGDLGYYTEKGEIVFLGRKDNQVKIRGYRIETGEVEAALLTHASVNAAAVLAKKDGGQYYLAGYYKTAATLNEEELRRHLAELLPEYMVPAHLVHMEEFPLTANGKINRNALPEPFTVVHEEETEEQYSPIEETLLYICREVLNRQTIRLKDNFFAIGGDSIKAIQVASRMSRAGWKIGVKEIFENPVFAELAQYVKKVEKTIDQSPVTGSLPLTPAQHRFFQTAYEEKHHYNQSLLFSSVKRWSAAGLQLVFNKILEHHDALRITFRRDEQGNWMQENIAPGTPAAIIEIDLTHETNWAEQMAEKADQIQSSLDLQNGPLLKVALFHLPEGSRMLVVLHHLVTDGVSWRILSEDISTLYEQFDNRQVMSLPLKTDAYKTWAEKLQIYSGSKACNDIKTYWHAVAAADVPKLPKDFEHAANLQQHRVNSSFTLSKKITSLLTEKVHKAFGTEINDILLVSLATAINKTFSIPKCMVALEGHGREEILPDVDVTRTVGWFTSVFPVLLDVSHPGGLSRHIIDVKEQLHSVPQRGVGFGILKYMAGDPLLQSVQPGISFNYLGEFTSQVALAEEASGRNTGSTWPAYYTLDVAGLIHNKELSINIEYNSLHYNEATIERLVAAYRESLEQVIHLCLSQPYNVLTPSDLTYTGISIDALQKLTDRVEVEDIYPLSPLQNGMLFLAAQQQEDAYYRQVHYTLSGQLQERFIEKTFIALFQRHDVLRTMFSEDITDVPVQIVVKDRTPEFLFEDLSLLPEHQRRNRLEEYRAADKKRSFRLDKDVLMRIAVFRLSEEMFTIVWSYHHILMDGWCSAILVSEFFEIYNSLLQGIEPLLEPVTPYRNYIRWLEKHDKQNALQYWKNYLDGYTEPAGLPVMKYAATGAYQLATVERIIPESMAATINELAAGNGVTLSTLLQSAWGVLLGMYTQRKDVVFGTVVSGRPEDMPGIESMIGLFINTIPVRVRFDGQESFSSLLKENQAAFASGKSFHYCQLAEIQSATGLNNQLLNHILVFENYPIEERIDAQVETMNNRDGGIWHFDVHDLQHEERSHYDFYLIITPGKNISLQFGFNKLVFDEPLIEQVAGHFYSLLEQFCSNAAQPLAALDVLSEEERTIQMQGIHTTTVEYEASATLVTMFEKTVRQYPCSVAVIGQEQSLTYERLNDTVNRLAWYLREEKGIRPGDLVGVMTGRTTWLPVSILAVLKAGGAYVPVDPSYPAQRKKYMAEDTGMKYVLTDDLALEEEAGLFELVYVPAVLERKDLPRKNPEPVSKPNDLAYIIYTSGSTGEPNGVMIEHHAVLNTFVAQKHFFGLSLKDKVLQFSSLSFDASVWEFIMAMMSGAALVMIPRNIIDDPQSFTGYINEKGVTIMTLPPVYLSLLDKEKLQHIRVLITAGEEARLQEAVEYSRKGIYWNAYGPSECSVCVSMHQVTPGDIQRARVPVGTAITNTRLFIMNREMELVPRGITGEICVAGNGLARGYWGRPELSARKFLCINGERVYRTGDLGRWLPDGSLEFLGRMDDQVKIRGHRIETGEILNTLKQHPAVQEAFVMAASGEEKFLIAYYTVSETVNREAIADHLRNHLPEFMIPAHLVQIDKFPLTPNGKIDRKLLPDPLSSTQEKRIDEPRTAEEKLLADIWKKVLGTEEIGANSNFYHSGGDSIKAMQIAARLYRAGYRNQAKDILQYPVLSLLAANLEKNDYQADQSVVTGNVLLTPAQHWFFENDSRLPHHFNQSQMLKAAQRLDHDILNKVFTILQQHHDALRMTFNHTGGEWKQFNEEKLPAATCILHNLCASAKPEKEMSGLADYYQQSLNLSTGPLMKPVLFSLPENDYLLIVLHHLVTDSVSWRILMEDLDSLYKQISEGRTPVLPPKTNSYKEWAEALNDYAHTSRVEKEKAYWQNVSAKCAAVRSATPAYNRLADFTVSNCSAGNEITIPLAAAAHKAYGTETGELLLAAFSRAMQKITGNEGVAIAMEGHGREHIADRLNISRTVGWFTSIYPAWLPVHNDMRQHIINTKEALRSIPQKGIGYGLLKYMLPGNELQQRLPATGFNYLGTFDETAHDGLFEATGSEGKNFSPERNWEFELSVSAYIKAGQLNIALAYNQTLFETGMIEKLEQSIIGELQAIISFCMQQEQQNLTPSDVTLKDISLSDLELLAKGLN